MKITIRSLILCSVMALGLTGCQTVDTVMGGAETRYACVEGSYLNVRPGYNSSRLDISYYYNGQLLYNGALNAMTSDFGQRFRAADGTSFWINGEKGLFSRPGEDMVLCHRE